MKKLPELNCEVKMLQTEKDNANLYIRTRNVFGDSIYHSVLEFTNNETYIANCHLQNSGKAATNSQSKCTFHHVYFTSDNKINKGDWFIYKGLVLRSGGYNPHAVDHYRIEASSDPSLDSCPLIDMIFLNQYAESNGSIKNVILEMELDLHSSQIENGNSFDVAIYKVKTDHGKVIAHVPKTIYSKEDITNLLSDYIFHSKLSDAPELLDLELKEARIEAENFVNDNLKNY